MPNCRGGAGCVCVWRWRGALPAASLISSPVAAFRTSPSPSPYPGRRRTRGCGAQRFSPHPAASLPQAASGAALILLPLFASRCVRGGRRRRRREGREEESGAADAGLPGPPGRAAAAGGPRTPPAARTAAAAVSATTARQQRAGVSALKQFPLCFSVRREV